MTGFGNTNEVIFYMEGNSEITSFGSQSFSVPLMFCVKLRCLQIVKEGVCRLDFSPKVSNTS